MSQINQHRSRFPKTRIKFSCWDIRCPINSSVNQCDQCHTMFNCKTLCLLQTITFSSTNIRSLVQINALSAVRRLDNLNIDLDGNPITKFTLWRMFVIFRLAHFALKKINDVEVKKIIFTSGQLPRLTGLNLLRLQLVLDNCINISSSRCVSQFIY